MVGLGLPIPARAGPGSSMATCGFDGDELDSGVEILYQNDSSFLWVYFWDCFLLSWLMGFASLDSCIPLSNFWFVAATQSINSIAFVFDGVKFGASDFAYSAYSMVLVAIASIAVIFVLSKTGGFVGIWVALTIFMGLHTFVGVWSYKSSNLSRKIKAYEQACIDVAFHPVMPNVIAS